MMSWTRKPNNNYKKLKTEGAVRNVQFLTWAPGPTSAQPEQGTLLRSWMNSLYRKERCCQQLTKQNEVIVYKFVFNKWFEFVEELKVEYYIQNPYGELF